MCNSRHLVVWSSLSSCVYSLQNIEVERHTYVCIYSLKVNEIRQGSHATEVLAGARARQDCYSAQGRLQRAD